VEKDQIIIIIGTNGENPFQRAKRTRNTTETPNPLKTQPHHYITKVPHLEG
jgi:hypothetical protein